MAKYQSKPVEAEIVSFDEFVLHGKSDAIALVNGMPWSFLYRGRVVTHENDSCYLINTPNGLCRFNQGELLVCYENGDMVPSAPAVVAKFFELVLSQSEEPVAE